jgi:hypothetical protein
MSRMIWVVVCTGCLLGCGESQKNQTKTGPTGLAVSKADRSRCDKSGKRVIPLDLNKDNQPDVWKIYASKSDSGSKVDILTCKEQDLNFDGRRDIWIYFDDNGNRQMEEMDLDFDGKVDLVTFYQGGKVTRQELDTNFDGSPDIWKIFEDKVLVRVERDSNYDGKMDYWEFYEGGELDRVGYDKNGDGRPDEFDRAPSQQTASAAPAAKPKEPAKDEKAAPAPEPKK